MKMVAGGAGYWQRGIGDKNGQISVGWRLPPRPLRHIAD